MAFSNRKDITGGGVTQAQVITLIQSHVKLGQAMTNISPGVWSLPNSDVAFSTFVDIYDGGGLLTYGTDYTFAGGTTATFVHGPTGTPTADYVVA